jgi:hypothetical protein
MNLIDENEVVNIIVRYGFDLGGQQASSLVKLWGSKYEQAWLLPATIESLDRGRYKVASIEQVLQGWQRQGKMVTRYKSDFAQMVIGRSDAAPMVSTQTPAAEDLSIDEEICHFSAHDLAEAHEFAAEIVLSYPALDEDSGNWGQSPFTTPFKTGVASDLAPSSYPPSDLRKPGEENMRSSRLATGYDNVEEFEPPLRVSQFYYRLLQMADTAPGQTPLWAPEDLLKEMKIG